MRTSIQTLLARVAVITGLGLAAVSAQAGGVNWAVNVNVPVQGLGYVNTAVSNHHHRAHGYGYPQGVVYVPAPVVVHQPPPRVVYVPGRVHVQPVGFRDDRGRWGHRPGHRHGPQGHSRWRDDDHRGGHHGGRGGR